MTAVIKVDWFHQMNEGVCKQPSVNSHYSASLTAQLHLFYINVLFLFLLTGNQTRKCKNVSVILEIQEMNLLL